MWCGKAPHLKVWICNLTKESILDRIEIGYATVVVHFLFNTATICRHLREQGGRRADVPDNRSARGERRRV